MSVRLGLIAVIVTTVLLAVPLPVRSAELSGTLRHLIANARTKADQEKIAGIYEGLVARAREDASNHRALAADYRAVESGGVRTGGFAEIEMSVHCENLADLYAKAAGEYAKLGELHRRMAAEMK